MDTQAPCIVRNAPAVPATREILHLEFLAHVADEKAAISRTSGLYRSIRVYPRMVRAGGVARRIFVVVGTLR